MSIDTLPPSPNGEIIHGQVREKVNEVITLINSGTPSFIAYHDGTFTMSTNDASPSFLTGDGVTNIPAITFDSNEGFELFDANTFAIKNTSGQVLRVIGDISWHPDKSGGGVAKVEVASESSFDNGVTWVLNAGSLRPQEIANDGETFQTKVSYLIEWQPNQIVRFRWYNSASGTVSIEPSSAPMLGQTATGHSVIWTLNGISKT